MQLVDVDLLISDNVSSNIFPGVVGCVESCKCSVIYDRKITDYRFNFCQFNPESANLHLHVAPSEKFYITVLTIAGNISCLVGFTFSERVINEDFCCFLRPVQISVRNLRPCNQ